VSPRLWPAEEAVGCCSCWDWAAMLLSSTFKFILFTGSMMDLPGASRPQRTQCTSFLQTKV